MRALKIHTKTDKNGTATIRVSTDVREVEMDIIVVLEEESKEKREETIKPIYDFSDLAGRLKWEGDPVEYQRTLREEW